MRFIFEVLFWIRSSTSIARFDIKIFFDKQATFPCGIVSFIDILWILHKSRCREYTINHIFWRKEAPLYFGIFDLFVSLPTDQWFGLWRTILELFLLALFVKIDLFMSIFRQLSIFKEKLLSVYYSNSWQILSREPGIIQKLAS